MEIVIHLTGAIEWTGWLFAMGLAAFGGLAIYAVIRLQRQEFKLKQFIRLIRRHPDKQDAEIGVMVEKWWAGD